MKKVTNILLKTLIIFYFINFNLSTSFADEELKVLVEQLQKDIQTLEKAVYSSASTESTSSSLTFSNSEDLLTRHLLKLAEIEEQFQSLTNKFEEINFKFDKISTRISKIQRDNQIRFEDIETGNVGQASISNKKKKKLPGTDEPQDLGRISDDDIVKAEEQKTLSIDSASSVITEEAERSENILPNKNPEEQYEFAKSFVKVGDYETAELALREFIDTNPKHELAGNAQYWYGETFRIRQLYQDAATAYLDGYQKYPKSEKAPLNLLKLGITLVQIGEKDQGCMMISGVTKQYPKANKSVLQKAEYEKKKFECKASS